MSSRQEQKLQARVELIAHEAKLKADQRRTRRLRGGAAVMVALALGGTVVALASSGEARMGRASSEPGLAPLATLGTLRAPGPPGPVGS